MPEYDGPAIDTSILGGDSGGGGVSGIFGQLGSILNGPLGQGLGGAAKSFGEASNQRNIADSLSLSPEGGAALKALLTLFAVPELKKQFGKDAALTDSADSTRAITDSILAQLPQLQLQGAASGGYNNTTQTLLTNNLVAQATAAGSKNQLAFIDSYTNNLNNSLKPILDALRVDQALVETRGKAATARGSASASQGKGILQAVGSIAGSVIGGPVGGTLGNVAGSVLDGLFK